MIHLNLHLLPYTTSSSLPTLTSSSLPTSSSSSIHRVSTFPFAFRWTVLHSFRTSLTFITASVSFTFTSPYQETHTLFTPSSNRRPNNIDDPIQTYNSCIGQYLQQSTKLSQSCVKPNGIHSFSRFRLGTIHPFDNPPTRGNSRLKPS
jgi:hypothetical protein